MLLVTEVVYHFGSIFIQSQQLVWRLDAIFIQSQHEVFHAL